MVREARAIENIEDSLRILSLLDAEDADYDPRKLPGQMLKTREDEVQNSAGGYVFQVSDLNRIRRFLILGTSGGTYYSTEKALTMNNLEALIGIIKNGKGGLIVREILEISLAGRAPKQEPTMFALALCARYDVKDRVSALKKKDAGEGEVDEIKFNDYVVQLHKAAFHAMLKVCRIPTHLFMFIKFCEMVSQSFGEKTTGWGRMMRKAVSTWYLKKDPKSLVMHITKYPQRENWSHRDVLRLAHPQVAQKGEDALVYDQIFHYATHGEIDTEKRQIQPTETDEPGAKKARRAYEVNDTLLAKEQNSQALKFLEAVIKMKSLKEDSDAVECAKLIRDYGLVREHVVNTSLLNTSTVWSALLEKMPLTALIRNLSKLSTLKLITGEKPEYEGYAKKVIEDITSEKNIKQSRVHPLTILLALTTYRSGHGLKGSQKWEVNKKICEALEKAFLLAFQNVEPTGKRFCLAYDVSGSMGSCIAGTNISCREASAAVGMCFIRKEPKTECMAFRHDFTPLPFTAEWDLMKMVDHIFHMDFGNTDCSLPMVWALKEKKEFDVFMVFTDCETYAGQMKPHEALKKYRTEMNIPDAKLIVCGMTSTGFTIADPTDPGMLDVVGFDSAVPDLVRSFVLGEI